MNYRAAIASVLNALIEQSGKTANGLAEKCGVSRQAVSLWRKGNTSMNVDKLPMICAYLDISISDFFEMVEKTVAGD